MFQPKSESGLPGKGKDNAKDPGKSGAKGAPAAATEPPVTLKPAGELTPPAAK
jgi:hypothetical protein